MNYRQLYRKNEDKILYLFFGICTTLVNVSIYWITARLLNFGTMSSTLNAWFLAVLFAYFTNRKWVFHSEAKKRGAILMEIFSFFSCRLVTGFVDWLCMFVFVDVLAWNDMLIKAGANILVIVLNYAASKIIIFKKRCKNDKK